MSGAGDDDGFQYDDDDVADETDDVDINENDPDPTAGASDIGGRAGELDPTADIDAGDLRGDDQHDVGGGQTGMGKGPTGS